jgi:glycosyltransferase involved in cell wall biosynthesis
VSTAVLITPKHPYKGDDGEIRVARLLAEASASCCTTKVIALSEQPGPVECPVDVVEVRKPPVRLARLAVESLIKRRSLLHVRFAPPDLVTALRRERADVFLAYRDYMAEAPLQAGKPSAEERLAVLAGPLESLVMEETSRLNPLVAVERRRTRRDEIRAVREASEGICLSDTEIAALGPDAGKPLRRLDLVLPPATQPAGLDDPVALFVGDRTWKPNREALEQVLRQWPQIHSRVPSARLLVAGRPGRGERSGQLAGVEVLGFVDDLDAVWQQAGVLIAPVTIGGGVRVKVLDAARHGVPVVATPAAVGSISDYLPVRGSATGEELVDDAASLLADRGERRRRGAELYEANAGRNAAGFVEAQVAEILTYAPAA